MRDSPMIPVEGRSSTKTTFVPPMSSPSRTVPAPTSFTEASLPP
jgi:hypothetical protein